MEAAEGDPPADLDPALPVTAEPRAASGDDQDATEPPNKRQKKQEEQRGAWGALCE